MRYSVDVICRYLNDKKQRFVLINRLTDPCGIAFPGGGIEKSENRLSAVIRETKEETGLLLHVTSWLPTVYNKEGRDPRFPATSYVACGEATGEIISEAGKTEVILLSKDEIIERRSEFVFDHFEMFIEYITLSSL